MSKPNNFFKIAANYINGILKAFRLSSS